MPAPHRGGVQVLRRSERAEHGERPAPTVPTERSGRLVPPRYVARPGQRREPVASTRPSGRPRGGRPNRLAVAVFGALSVVGVGVAGVAVGSSASASGYGPMPQRLGGGLEPASATFVNVQIAPIDWTQDPMSSQIPVERVVARR